MLFLAITVSVGIVVLLLIIDCLFCEYNYHEKVWLPFYNNLETLKNFSVEQTDPLELQTSDIDEFQELNNSLIKIDQ